MARFSAGARLNTDDDGWVEYRVADRMLSGATDESDAILKAIAAP